MSKPKYFFYATLLDAFQNYLDSDKIYQKYWGNSTNPKFSEQEFENEQFQNLIDRINRVPFESEAAEKGTAFNDTIDYLLGHKSHLKYTIDYSEGFYNATNNDWQFSFSKELCEKMSSMLQGALVQQMVSSIMPTSNGNVVIYGYLDDIMPFVAIDIKTTKQYKAFMFRNRWQHKAYLFCLNDNQIHTDQFQYVVTDFKNIYTEVYNYDPDRHFRELQQHCKQFIDFLNINKHLITDVKIFGKQN